MTPRQWQVFCRFRDEFRCACVRWDSAFAAELAPLQRAAARADTPDYPLETPVVYNTALDSVSEGDELRMVLVGDNPGKAEQLSCNRRYLVGQSGKIAQGFFAANSSLGIDFRKNVVILNKTPVHTAKTPHLKYLLRSGSDSVRGLVLESQLWMARQTARLHRELLVDSACGLWLVGYAELKGKGIFAPYRDALLNEYGKPPDALWRSVMVFQHFSMNRFLIDLKAFASGADFPCGAPALDAALEKLGERHRHEVFGV